MKTTTDPSEKSPGVAMEPGPPAHRGGPAKALGSVLVILVLLGVRYAVSRGTDEVIGPGGVLERTIVDDDFSDRDGAWKIVDDADTLLAYEDGAYRIVDRDGRGTVSASFIEGRSVSAVVVEADVMANAEAPPGLVGVACVFGTDPDLRVFFFGVDPLAGQFMVGKLIGGRPFEPIAVGRDVQSPSVFGASNATPRVRGECGVRNGGTDLAMYVNSRLVVTGRAPVESGFSGIGLAALSSSAGTDARFDDVLAARIDVEDMPAATGAGVDVRRPDQRPPQGALVFADDFSDRTSGWFDGRGDGYRIGYEGRAYRIVVERPHEHRYVIRWPDRSSGAQTVEVVAAARDTALGGAFGPMCVAAHDPTDGYVFAIDPALSTYTVLRIDDDGWPATLQFGTTQTVLAMSPNVVRGDCVTGPDGGVELTMSINGVVVASVNDPQGFARFIGPGMYAESDAASLDARFDDLAVFAR